MGGFDSLTLNSLPLNSSRNVRTRLVEQGVPSQNSDWRDVGNFAVVHVTGMDSLVDQ